MSLDHLEAENLRLSAIAKAKVLEHIEAMPDSKKEKLR